MARQTASAQLVELRVATSATRAFSGYGSVFDVEDSYGDIVAPGAFARTLKERQGQILMLWQHDTSEPIGAWTEIREDARGLFVRGTLSDTQRGRDAYTLLKDGALSGLSIGFRTRKSHQDAVRQVRVIDDVELMEISLVSLPANDAARVAEVRAATRSQVLQEIDTLATRLRYSSLLGDLQLLGLQMDVARVIAQHHNAHAAARLARANRLT